MMSTENDINEHEYGTTTITVPQHWKTKRRRTFSTFLLNRFIQGLEFTMIASTLLSYVRNGLSTSNTNLFYGLIAGGRAVAAIALTGVVSRWYDKNQSLKSFTLLVSFFISVGYILYAMNFSPYLPLLGSIFFGCSVLLTSVINSEVHRLYASDDIQQMFVLIMLAYAIGETLGPVCVKLLDKVDIWFGSLHIMYGNVSCLVLFSVNTFRFILACFFTHDLSKEFDLKAAHSASDKTVPSKASLLMIIRRSFGPDALYLYLRQLYTQFFFVYQIRVLPLIIARLGYSNLFLDVCLILISVLMTVICLLMKFIGPSSRGVFNCGVVSLLTVLVSNVLYLLVGRGYGNIANKLILFLLVFTYAFAWITDTSFIVVTLGKLFPSSVQSSVEGARMLVQVVGAFLGSLTSAYVYASFDRLSPLFIVVSIGMLVLMFMRRKVLQNPCVMVYDNQTSNLIDADIKISSYGTIDNDEEA